MTLERAHPIHCAWCGETVGYSETEASHGLCDSCFQDLEGVPGLDREELDDLPYGVIELDAEGIVRSYNVTEQQLSGLSESDVVGRSFFRDIAPCTRVRGFEGRWREFVSSSEATEPFTFTFPFPDGSVEVSVVFVRSDDSTQVLVRARELPPDDSEGS